MARGRMINQKIASDIDFNEMSIDAQFLFMRAIPFLDRDGLIVGHPGLLWSKIAPLLTQYTAIMSAIIDEWVSTGFVVKYEHGKTPILFFKGFSKNQAMTHYDREAPSEFPPPPGHHRTPKGLKPLSDDDGGNSLNPPAPEPKEPPPSISGHIPDADESNLAELRTDSGLTPDEPLTNSSRGRGMEVEVKEKGREGNAPGAVNEEIAKPPPSFSSPPVSPANQPSRYLGREQNQIAEHIRSAKSFGVSAEVFRLMVDAFLDCLGTRSRANAQASGEVLREAQSAINELIHYESGKFRTVEAVKSILISWKANDYRGDTPPTQEQFLSHAGLMDMGKVVCTRKNPSAATPGVILPPINKPEPAYKRLKALN